MALDYREKVVGLYRSLGFEADELAVLAALTVGDKEELSLSLIHISRGADADKPRNAHS